MKANLILCGHTEYVNVPDELTVNINEDEIIRIRKAIEFAKTTLKQFNDALIDGAGHTTSMNIHLYSIDIDTGSSWEYDTCILYIDTDGDTYLRLYGKYDGFDWAEYTFDFVGGLK